MFDAGVPVGTRQSRQIWHSTHGFGPGRSCDAGTIFQIGIAPNRIDVITSIDAIPFDVAWENRVATTYDGVAISLLGLSELLVNKRSVGRPQDLLDVAKLELVRARKPPHQA